jgi:CheY-like chemotaxis protein
LLDTDFAVLLLDVYMPVMDGLETAELIRGRENREIFRLSFLRRIQPAARISQEAIRSALSITY